MKAKSYYPTEVWEKAMTGIHHEIDKRVVAETCTVIGAQGAGGQWVSLDLSTTTAATRQHNWEVAARGVLETYEKEHRKERSKKIN